MMKKFFILAAALVLAGNTFAIGADTDKGKALFESPKLGNGTTGKSCVTCHPGGKHLGKDLFDRNKLTIMGDEKDNLAGVINTCIEKPLGGTAIDPNGEEMQDLIAYMKTLVTNK